MCACLINLPPVCTNGYCRPVSDQSSILFVSTTSVKGQYQYLPGEQPKSSLQRFRFHLPPLPRLSRRRLPGIPSSFTPPATRTSVASWLPPTLPGLFNDGDSRRCPVHRLQSNSYPPSIREAGLNRSGAPLAYTACAAVARHRRSATPGPQGAFDCGRRVC